MAEDIEELDLDELEASAEDVIEEEGGVEEGTKKTTTKAKEKPAKQGIGTSELAAALGSEDKPISGRELRVLLRDKGANKTERFQENKRYHWDSLQQALEELGFDDVDEAREALSESRSKRLENLKEKVAEKRAAAAETSEDKAEAVEEV